MSATIISAPPVRGALADRELDAVNGYVMLAIGLASIAICCWLAYIGFDPRNGSLVRAWIGLSPIIIAIVIVVFIIFSVSFSSTTTTSTTSCTSS